MATTDPIPSLPHQVSQDDGGLWMKMDFSPVIDHTEMTQGNLSLTSAEKPHEDTEVFSTAPTGVTRYCVVMGDGDGEDDIFIPPPPSCTPPPPPTGVSTGAADPVNNSSVAVTVGVTEAEANPKGLESHHGEEHFVAAQNKVDEVAESKGQVNPSKQCVDTISLSEERDSTPSSEQDQTSMESTSILTESNEGSEHVVMWSEESNSPQGNNAEGDTHQNTEEITGKETDYDTPQTEEEMRGNKTSTESAGETEDIRFLAKDTELTLTTESVDSNTGDTNTATLPGVNVSDSDFSPPQKKTCGPPELCKCNKSKIATYQPEVPESPAEVSSDVDTRSLNYNVTKEQWVRRESATSEIPLPQLPISQGSSIDCRTEALHLTDEQEGGEDGPEKGVIGSEGDENGTIATDIQQGRQLLQRLQLVQQIHDVKQVSYRPPPSQQDALETANQSTRDGEVERGVFGIEGEDLGAERGDQTTEEKGDSRFKVNHEEGGKTNQLKKEKREKSERKEAGEQAMSSSSTMPARPSHRRVTKVEADNSDDDQSDSGVSADFSPINTREIPSAQIPTLPTRHQASTTETPMAREIQHNLQRARGLFNLADDSDNVLEIPFKTNILPKTLPNKAGPGQSTDWPFSEEKMQREISQEFHRELVLVKQGKIPGEYSKGPIRVLKETKMLFEAFQQDNTERPTRHRKPPSSSFKGHVYPSVLERTRSMEMLSLKSRPISRTHSLRLHKSTAPERSLENRRSKSPVGRDNTRLLPYSKQDKYLRLYRSMDSLNIDVPTSKVEMGSKMRERNQRHESLLNENPFFKLRPALALQPDLAKDIWEAKEREEELHRQRCTLYGETRPKSTESQKSHAIPSLKVPDPRQRSKGKLDRIWPPPSKKDQMKSGQTQQESKVHKAGGQKAPLWQRWESGQINGQPSKKKN